MPTARPFPGASVALAALSLLLGSVPAAGADAQGQFAIKGVGLLTCEQSVQARESQSALDAAFRGWIQGFVTGVNRYQDGTYDAAPWGTPEILATIVYNHCRENPQERFVEAVQKLVATLQKDRLSKSSPLLTVDVDGRRTLLYQEMLKRVQERLADQGLYLGTADGVFGPRTQEAIAMYQISEGLEGTGVPDPLTVWKLVQP